jgi:hypothetical protein
MFVFRTSTAAQNKQRADKILNTLSQGAPCTSSKVDMKSELVPRNETSKERALSPTPTTTKSLKFEGDGFMSLCSPAGSYKEERYWCQEIGFKIVDFGDADIQPDSVVAGGMPLRVLLLDI